MRNHSPKSLKRSLLGCAIATALSPAVGAADGLTLSVGFSGTITAVSGTITANAGGWGSSGIYYYVGDGSSSAIVNSGGLLIDPVPGSDAFVAGVYLPDDISDSIHNTGTISVAPGPDSDPGLVLGFYLTGSVTGEGALINDGRIEAATEAGAQSNRAVGLSLAGMTGAAGVANAGTLWADAVNAGSRSAFAAGLDVGGLQDVATITNSGTVVARARAVGAAFSASATAVGLGAGQVLSGTSIANSGTIVAAAAAGRGSAHAYGLSVYTLEGRLENSGGILALIASPGEAYGIKVAGGAGEVVNTGVMLGGLDVGGTISVTNAGHITSWSHSASRVSGDYTQLAGGEIGVRVWDAAAFGALDVGGVADFTGSNRLVVSLDAAAQLAAGDVLQEVVRAGTLVAPSGIAVSDTSLFWVFAPILQGNYLDLVVARVDAATVLGAAAGLPAGLATFVDDVLLAGQGGHFAGLARVLNMTPSRGALLQVLDELTTPAAGGAAGQAARIAGAAAGNAVSARLGETRGAASGDAAAAQALWIKPFLGRAGQEQVDGIRGYDVDTTGFVMGIDGELGDEFRLGVAVASAQSDVESGASRLDVDTTQLALYGSHALGGSTALDASLSYAANRYDSHRQVGFAGSSAIARYEGRQLALAATLSQRFARGRTALVPSLALQYTQVEVDDYTEAGAGPYNLQVQEGSDDAVLAVAKADFELAVGERGRLITRLGAGYDGAPVASATVSLGGNGPTFISHGIRPASSLVTAGLGYRHVTSGALEINAAYDAERREDFLAQTLSLKFRLPF